MSVRDNVKVRRLSKIDKYKMAALINIFVIVLNNANEIKLAVAEVINLISISIGVIGTLVHDPFLKA